MVNKFHCGKASMTVHEGREVIGSILYCAVNKFHYRKANMAVHEGREVTSSGQYSAILKNITMANQVGHCMRNKRLQV